MKTKEMYSIGDMSEICNISKKALRYYDKIGLITSRRQDYNNYRYYTIESLLAVPVIKYYKQMGFTLDEMRVFIEGNVKNVYSAMQKSFLGKLTELETEQEAIRRKYISVKDWYNLILEAEMVLEHGINEVSVKYIEPTELLYQTQQFDNDNKASVINIEFTNYLEKIGNEITGPVMLNFSSFEDRIHNVQQEVRIMQKALLPSKESERIRFGGGMMITCYHIGPHEALPETYNKICRWSQKHGYELSKESFERYVTDYWSTSNSMQFVTEVMLTVTRRSKIER